MNPLKTLVSKLNPACRTSLEKAVSNCLNRSHYNVELEHWLLALLEDDNGTLTLMLKNAGCNIDKLIADINRSLEGLRKGNDQNPALSNRIIDLINEAWLIASLDYDGEQIHSGILLCALVQNNTLSQLCHAISAEFDQLSPDDIRQLLQVTLEQATEKPDQADADAQTVKAKSKTPALDQYTTNLNEQAKSGKIDMVIGREDEVRQVIDILSRRRQNNAILTGEPGVGKTAIVEGFALRIVQNDVPESLQDVVIHSLDMGLLQAGAGVKGEFENRLKSLIDEVKRSPYPIILFIDEAHTLIGAGAASGQNDAANLLKPALARGELRSIAATTWAEYKQYFEKDAALTRRFQVVKVEEPDAETATRMLRSLVPSLEKHHNVKILDDAVQQATLLSQRYITGRQLPDKSISVLDTACARVASKQTTTPAEIEKSQKLHTQLELELKRLQKEQQQGFDHQERITALQTELAALHSVIEKRTTQWQQAKELVSQIIQVSHALQQDDKAKGQTKPKAKAKTKNSKQIPKASPQVLEELHKSLAALQGDSPLIQAYVDGQAVAEVIADWTGIPAGRMLKDEVKQILNIDQTLAEHIVGQDHALASIAKRVRTSAAKLADPGKPIGVFLFVGPSGVGKTETAINLAESLYGSADKMTVINMSEFKEEHKISMLAGSPPGYVGYGEGGVLTEAVRRKPYSLVLLDEMEKAHPSIQEVFYQVFDKGMLKDGQGRDIDFKNTLIIMTSNACSDTIAALCDDPETMPTPEALTKALQDELLKTFKPAFLGRVNVIPYLPLSEKVLADIVKLKLQKVQQRVLAQQRLELGFEPAVIESILAKCQNQAIGARQIDNIITNTILPQVSDTFLTAIVNEKTLQQIRVGIDKNGDFSYHTMTKPSAAKNRQRRTSARPVRTARKTA